MLAEQLPAAAAVVRPAQPPALVRSLRRVIAIGLVFLLAFTGLRLLVLDADPPWTKRVGDISDEGYWAHSARMKVLTGSFSHDPFTQALVTAPLFTGITYLVFKTFGISLSTARLPSALAGVLTVLIGAAVILAIARDAPWAGAVFLLLALNDLFFAYNRIGHVESVLNMFIAFSFLTLYVAFERRSRFWWFVLSGAIFGLAVLTKITAVYTVLGVVLAFGLEWLARKEIRITSFMAWILGLGVPVLIGAWLLWANYAADVVKFFTMYAPLFVGDAGLYAKAVTVLFNPLRLFTNPFLNTFSVTLLLLLCGWRLRLGQTLGVHGLERICLAWLAGTLVTVAWVPYQADRRVWGVLIPLAVIAGRLLASLRTRETSNAGEQVNGFHVPDGVWHLGLWYVTTYATAAVLEVLVRLPLDAQNISYRPGLVQLLVIGTAAVFMGLLVYRRRIAAVVSIGLLAPLTAFCLEWNLTLLWPAQFTRNSVMFLVVLPVAIIGAAFLIRHLQRDWRRLAFALAWVYVVWCSGVVASAFWNADYSVKAAALDVNRMMQQTEPSPSRRYVLGIAAHQLALEGDGFPLFFTPGDLFRGLNRDSVAFTPHVRFFVDTLGPLPRARLGSPHPLPEGLEGRVLSTHCLYPSSDLCERAIRLVDLTRVDVDRIGRSLDQP